jgi:hypothetical protein
MGRRRGILAVRHVVAGVSLRLAPVRKHRPVWRNNRAAKNPAPFACAPRKQVGPDSILRPGPQ